MQQAKQAPSQPVEEVENKPAVAAVAPKKVAELDMSPVPVSPAVEKTIQTAAQIGKRSNTEFLQVNVYLRKTTMNKAKIALLQRMDERDFSELMEDLLSSWVSQQTPQSAR